MSARAFCRAALALALLAPAAAARAETLGTVALDFVRVDRGGGHTAVVSVLDPGGHSLEGLEHSFAVRFDGQPLEGLTARPARQAFPRAAVTVVIDGSLLQGDGLGDVQDALRTLVSQLAPNDRLRVIGVGHALHSREATVRDAAGLIGGVGGLADGETPLLYDGMFEAARAAAHRGDDESAVVLVITRGTDGGSQHHSVDVLALARTRTHLTPIMVAIVGDQGAAVEGDRLLSLTTHAAGACNRVGSLLDLGSQLELLLDRGLHRWILRFKPPAWNVATPRHHVEVEVTSGGESLGGALDYVTADALAAPWWRALALWITLGLLVLLAGVLLLIGRRRQRGLLVHDGDADDGVWYELMALPVTVGGAAGNDLVIADAHVSRNHAVLERRGRNIELVDLNSENGTFVNGERISRRALADGDRIALGPDVHLIYEARS